MFTTIIHFTIMHIGFSTFIYERRLFKVSESRIRNRRCSFCDRITAPFSRFHLFARNLLVRNVRNFFARINEDSDLNFENSNLWDIDGKYQRIIIDVIESFFFSFPDISHESSETKILTRASANISLDPFHWFGCAWQCELYCSMNGKSFVREFVPLVILGKSSIGLINGVTGRGFLLLPKFPVVFLILFAAPLSRITMFEKALLVKARNEVSF